MNKKRERQQHQQATANCGTGYEINKFNMERHVRNINAIMKSHNATMNS